MLFDLKIICLIKKLKKLKEIYKNTYNLEKYHILIFFLLVLGDGKIMKKKTYPDLPYFISLYLPFIFKNKIKQLLFVF